MFVAVVLSAFNTNGKNGSTVATSDIRTWLAFKNVNTVAAGAFLIINAPDSAPEQSVPGGSYWNRDRNIVHIVTASLKYRRAPNRRNKTK